MVLTERDYKILEFCGVAAMLLATPIMLLELVGRYLFNMPIEMANVALAIGFAATGISIYTLANVIRINNKLNIKM